MRNSAEIFGGEIEYFRLEPKYWEPIIQHFVDAGLRCATSYIPWQWHAVDEPDAKHPAGVMDFEGRTDPKLNLHKFLNLIEKYGLNFNFRVGPFCCSEMVYGGYPRWIALGDPNMMVWDYQNRIQQGYWIAKPEGSQPSYLHEDYLAQVRAWFEAADEVLAPHLKSNGGCVTMINLDNEVSYIVQDAFGASDYNPINVRPGGFYHQFLADKYGSAKKLPYEKRYRSIDDVPAPRTVPDEVGRDLPYYTDWCEFKTWAMCEYIRRLRRMHEDNGVRDVTYMTNFNPHRPEGVPTRMPDFERATDGVAGYDFYRGTFMTYSGYHSMSRILKLMNASLSYTWSAEFMSGTWNRILWQRVSTDHMRFMARCALSQGCKSISWYMFHDRDTWGDTPCSEHAQTRPALEVLRETMTLVKELTSDWDALTPQCDVAIVYDLLAHQHTYLGDPNPCADNDLHVGAPTIDGIQAGKSSAEYEGLFRLVEQAGYQAGAVDILEAPERIDDYPMAMMPGGAVIERDANRALKKFVRGGGVLVVSGPWPRRDELGKSVKFLGLDEPKRSRGVKKIKLGDGLVLWNADWIAQAEPEKESLDNVELVGKLLKRHVGRAHVSIRPAGEVGWINWGTQGKLAVEPHNLGAAILHAGGNEKLLYVHNLYPVACEFELAFRDKPRELVDLFSHQVIPVKNGRAVVDVDRKHCDIFRVVD